MTTDIETPIGSAPVIPVILIGAGMYLAWFGIHYWDSDTKYPTDPVKAVLQGKPLPVPAGQMPAQQVAQQAVNQAPASPANPQQLNSSIPANNAGVPSIPNAPSGSNQQKGALVAAAYGWGPGQNGTEWNALVKLWNQESGWSNTTRNSQSGAYGIAQALGHGNGSATQGSVTNEYGGYGISDTLARAANSGDAVAQITWGCQYIKATYGDPAAAWRHEQNFNWY